MLFNSYVFILAFLPLTLLGYFLLRSPAMLTGLADQAIDFTHRREELEKSENPFDPRRGE